MKKQLKYVTIGEALALCQKHHKKDGYHYWCDKGCPLLSKKHFCKVFMLFPVQEEDLNEEVNV